MATLNVYGVNAVSAILNSPSGIVDLMKAGLSESAGFKAERVGETIFYEMTATGEPQISQNPSTTHMLTLPIAKTSTANNQLQIMAAIQRLTPIVIKATNLVLADTLGKNFVTFREVSFMQEPPLEWGQKGGFNEWKFLASFVDRVSI